MNKELSDAVDKRRLSQDPQLGYEDAISELIRRALQADQALEQRLTEATNDPHEKARIGFLSALAREI